MTMDGAARVESVFRQALALHRQSRLDEARSLYQRALQFDPRHFQALHLSGVIALQTSDAGLAAELIAKALELEPSSVAAHVNYGTAQHELKNYDAAIASFDAAIALDDGCAEAHHNRGNSLRELKQFTAAADSSGRAVILRPEYADAHLNRGLALSGLDQHEAAIASYERALAVQPNFVEAHFNLGNELRALGRFEAAVASYEKAIALQPGYADAHLNRGAALIDLRRYAAALASYQNVVRLRPDFAEAHFNAGGAFQHLGQYADAVASYDKAIAIRPDHSQAFANRGRALRELRQFEAAIASYNQAIACTAETAALKGVRQNIKMQICDWREFGADLAQITGGIARGTAAPHPFYVFAVSDSAALQRRAAENWLRDEYPALPPIAPLPKRESRGTIHLGYFSADFHDHATAYLIAQLLELHDRSRFRVTGFSFGPDSQGTMRKRLRAACDDFQDVRQRSDADVAMLARNSRVDIAVDLKGFTQDNRAGIFLRRAAPLQVNYLGYPATMGTRFIDYIIADRELIPETSQAHYAEKIAYLPFSYQVNDATRAISERWLTRAELGLPASGFIFCCFNNSYKILPALFDHWMRILARVEGSVLWLLGDNSTAMRNLRLAAADRRIDPARLVFADRVPLAEHLARHRVADLFIDTLPCNAHTTASDALWAGLPLLTCRGEGFASRVAASLLESIGLPELIVSTLQDYENLAVHLAGSPHALADLRRRLAENRLTAPLFDTPRYARHLEGAYAMMMARYQAGLSPEHLFVDMLERRVPNPGRTS